MKKVIALALLLIGLVACNNKGDKVNDPIDGGHGIGIDTAAVHIIQCQEEIANEPVKGSPKKVAPATSSSRQEPDNMRGFDPPSEDDMDDNGMTRYMEVNDEEGWE